MSEKPKVAAQTAALIVDLVERGGKMRAGVEAWRHSSRAWRNALLMGWVRELHREASVGNVVRVRELEAYELTDEGHTIAAHLREHGVQVEDLERWAAEFKAARERARGEAQA